jgi:transcriptional regulator with XRE-family HTH domain
MAGKKPWDQRRLRLQKLLRELRIEAGLLQTDIAKRLRVDQSFVSRYERGERRLDLVELSDICVACNSSLLELVRRFSKPGRG